MQRGSCLKQNPALPDTQQKKGKMKRGLMFFFGASCRYSYIKYIYKIHAGWPANKATCFSGNFYSPPPGQAVASSPELYRLTVSAGIPASGFRLWSRRHRRDGANTTGGPISRPRSRRHCRVSGNPTGGLFLCHYWAYYLLTLCYCTCCVTILNKLLASMHIFYDTTSYQPSLTCLLRHFSSFLYIFFFIYHYIYTINPTVFLIVPLLLAPL
jgi:hypothetical protein